jgi:uncharacterized protein (DUF2062 family)
MPRRVFKSLNRQRHRWNERWFMRPFRLLLEHPVYWSLNRRNVSRAFALGLAIAFVPIPVHFLLATVLALSLRLNVPAAIFGTFLANPLTMVPMYMGAYWIGSHLLGITTHPIAFTMTWDWLTTSLLPIWKPFLLGCLVLSAIAALIGYALLGGIWHLSLVLKYHERKGASNLKASAKAEK